MNCGKVATGLATARLHAICDRFMLLRIALLLIVLCISSRSAEPVRIFFDTDMDTDCDDAGAMAVLHALADRGECQILATVVSVRHPGAAPTVAAINAYYGRADLPIGGIKTG